MWLVGSQVWRPTSWGALITIRASSLKTPCMACYFFVFFCFFASIFFTTSPHSFAC